MEVSKLFQHLCNFGQFLPWQVTGRLRPQQLHSQFFLTHHQRMAPYYWNKSRCLFGLSGLFLKICQDAIDPERIRSKIGSGTRHQIFLQFAKFLSMLVQISV